MKKIETIITIKEDVKIGNIILEKGDKIKVLEDSTNSVLPLGKLNLVTGKTKMFNVYDTWNGSDMVAEVWKSLSTDIIYYVFTSGNKPIFNIGDKKDFLHDQTGRFLFSAEMIDWALLSEMKTKLAKYGNQNSYVYK